MFEGVRRYLRAHREAAVETYRFLALRTFGSLVVWIMIGAALALPTALYLASYNLSRVQAEWASRPALSVFFAPGLAPQEVEALRQRIDTAPGVESLVFVSADEALRDLSGRLALKDDLAALGSNPLPASVLVTASPEANVDTIERSLRGMSGVDQIIVERAWLERLAAVSRLVTRLSWLVGALLALTAAVVAGSAVRLAIDERLEEVLVLRLVGATDRQIRRPFLYLGLWYGLGGGLLGALVLAEGLTLIADSLKALSSSYGVTVEVGGFDVWLVLALVLIGATLGVLGAAISARRSTARAKLG